MLNNTNSFFFKKRFELSSFLILEYFFFKTQKFLFITNNENKKVYFLIPNLLNFKYNKNFLFFFTKNICKKLLFIFFFNFTFFFKQIKNIFYKTLYIRGMNYKINFLENSVNILKLKLGYSHLIFLNLVNNIYIKILKKKIIFKCFSKIILGNFIKLLYYYRPINIFTGKGLLIKTRKKFKLKEYSKKI
jgi:hypothetical protein